MATKDAISTVVDGIGCFDEVREEPSLCNEGFCGSCWFVLWLGSLGKQVILHIFWQSIVGWFGVGIT
jgi:hypothetical protein